MRDVTSLSAMLISNPDKDKTDRHPGGLFHDSATTLSIQVL